LLFLPSFLLLLLLLLADDSRSAAAAAAECMLKSPLPQPVGILMLAF